MFAKEKDCHGKRGYIVATLPYFWHKYTRSGITFILLQFFANLTLSLVILLAVCHTIYVMLVWRIWNWINH